LRHSVYIHRVPDKQNHFCFWQMWSDLNNSLTIALSDKLRKRQKQMLPPHIISVATLPC